MRQRRNTHRRGRTRSGRLALLDRLLQSGAISLRHEGAPLFVDIGFGDEPTTTLECADALSTQLPRVSTVGVEVDAPRAERAQAYVREGVRFVTGGFDISALHLGEALLVRCFNVLRGYGIDEVKPAQILMIRALAPGGLLIEGSTDPTGALLTAHLWRRTKDGLFYEGLVCATDFTRGFAPLMFRDVLPRDLRRHGKVGEPAFDWLSQWNSHATRLRELAKEVSPERRLTDAEVFTDSARELARTDPRTDVTETALGAVIFRPSQPSDRPEVLRPRDFS